MINNIESTDTVIIKEIVSAFTKYFKEYDYEIKIFGSYSEKYFSYNDIDLALIISTTHFSNTKISEKLLQIKEKFLNKNIQIEVTTLGKNEFDKIQYYHIINSVLNGRTIYKTSNYSQEMIKNYKFKQTDYLNFLQKTFNQIRVKNENHDAIFYMYRYIYHAMIFILSKNNIIWKSTTDLKIKFYYFSKNIIKKTDRLISIKIYRTFEKLTEYKNKELDDEQEKLDLKSLYDEILEINNWLDISQEKL